jgi:hypothetical protein
MPQYQFYKGWINMEVVTNDGHGTKKNDVRLNWRYILTIIPSIVLIFGAIWWAAGIDKEVQRIPNIEKKIDNLIEKVSENNMEKKQNNANTANQKNYVIGLINEKLTVEKKTSFGLPYFLDYNICETNASSERWNELGGLPYAGQFLKISNSYNKYESWCMNIGQFSDINNPNRLLIVSGNAAKDLKLLASMGTIVGRIELIQGDEWKKDNNKVNLHDKIYGMQ